MIITTHKLNTDGTFTDIKHEISRDSVNEFIEDNIKPGEYFLVGSLSPDGWYEREYCKGASKIS